MIANLPTYDGPETAAANDRLWDGIARALRARGIAAPDRLDRTADMWTAWLSPDLLLSQTCGLPYRTRLHGRVALVATPICDLPGVAPGRYHSVLVARRDDPRRALKDFGGATLARNDALSQSGWAAPMAEAAAAGIDFGGTIDTGGHRLSARKVAEGAADLAAIDGLTWRMIRRWDGFADGLREIGTTAPTPALPWITALGNDAATLAEALAEGLAGLTDKDRDSLGILGAIRLEAADYLAVPNPPSPWAEAAQTGRKQV